jgi:hypothetical protein
VAARGVFTDMHYKGYIFFAYLLLALESVAQYTADKVIGQKNEALMDSLRTVHYPYVFPIFGQRVINKGFNMPLPAGVSVQYLWQQSQVIINNLQVGFNNGPKYGMDEVIRFDDASTTSNGINIRPDFWLFPFLNVYAIFARSKMSTGVKCGLWIPDSTEWRKAVDFDSKVEFNATTVGFGLTPTFGIGGFFIAIDMNFSWTDIDQLDKPAYVFVLGPRIGKNFRFKDQQSLAVWAGGFRVQLENGTSGSLPLSEVLPVDQWQLKVDTGMMRVANSQSQVDAWWSGLTATDQKNPVNIAKHTAANAALARAGQFLNGASEAITGAGNSTVQYSLDKAPKDKWNFIIGAQYQLNRRFMIRGEYGFLGSRQQFIGGLQYRFGF